RGPMATGTRMVDCVKFDTDLQGIARVPWRGELGKRVYENVSKDAWKLWIEHSKMIMKEYRLNPLDPNSQKIMEEQLEQFFVGEGANLPEGYVAPKAQGGGCLVMSLGIEDFAGDRAFDGQSLLDLNTQCCLD